MNSLIKIYHALFQSHIRYACQVWGLCDTYITHRILTLQKTALRLITFNEPRAHSNPIFSKLGILKFFDLVKVLNIQLVHQHLNANLPVDLISTLSFETIDHQPGTRTRFLGLLKLKCCTHTFGLNSLTNLATQQWNEIQACKSNINLANLRYSSLRTLTRKHYLQSYHESC